VQAKGELDQASALVTTLQDQVLEGDRAGATTTLTALQDHAALARTSTHGPQWSAAAALPWIGPNVEAVQAVTDVVDALAASALPALMEATQIVDPAALVPVDGRVDIGTPEAAAPAMTTADDAVASAISRLDDVDDGALWSIVAEPFTDVRGQVTEVAATTSTASRAAQLLPSMLGADGPRDYLLLVQDGAELRATGGAVVMVALLRAQDGGVSIVESRSAASLGDLEQPAVALTDAESALFGPGLVAGIRDATLTPDFPRTAEIVASAWAREVGGDVDGVLSVDAGTIALLLDDTGPVALPPGPAADALGGELTAENAVSALLSTVYVTLTDPADQDAFVADATASVLGALLAGQGAPAAAIDALAEAARQGRLMLWSAHSEEQSLLAGTVLAGELTGDEGGTGVVGVFLNDTSGAKMSGYVRADVVVEQVECRADGSRVLDVAVTLTSTVTSDVVAGLPSQVTGAGVGVPIGDVRTDVVLYAPTGGLVDDVRVTGVDPGGASQVHDELAVAVRTTFLSPGESATVSARVTTSALLDGPVVLRRTPTVQGETSVLLPASCP